MERESFRDASRKRTSATCADEVGPGFRPVLHRNSGAKRGGGQPDALLAPRRKRFRIVRFHPRAESSLTPCFLLFPPNPLRWASSGCLGGNSPAVGMIAHRASCAVTGVPIGSCIGGVDAPGIPLPCTVPVFPMHFERICEGRPPMLTSTHSIWLGVCLE